MVHAAMRMYMHCNAQNSEKHKASENMLGSEYSTTQKQVVLMKLSKLLFKIKIVNLNLSLGKFSGSTISFK